MPIMTDKGFSQDTWTRVDAEAEIAPASLVAFETAAARWDELAAGADAIGLEIANDADLAAVAPYLDRVDMIALPFPSFADGRSFSQARRLRAMGFNGALRATGKLVADQYAYARACGFDEVEVDAAIADRQPERQWLAMGDSLTFAYQRGYLGGRNILEARRAMKLAAE